MKPNTIVTCLFVCLLSACEAEIFTPALPPEAAPAIVPASTRGYVMVDLGTLGGIGSRAMYINDAGQVVGHSVTSSGEAHVFFWENGVKTDLGTLGGTLTQLPIPEDQARPLSDAGHVIGLSTTAGDAATHSFIWHHGTMVDLGPVHARWVNASGQVVGVTELTDVQNQRAFIWQSGALTDLGSLGGTAAAAWSINNLGQIAGRSSVVPGDARARAVRWVGGTMSPLGTLWPDPLRDTPFEINDQGYIVGIASVSATVRQAFRWFNGTMIDLGNLGGPSTSVMSTPLSVNASGHVVGRSRAPGDVMHAFVWANGVMRDLGTLGGANSEALQINDAGQIVGEADDGAGLPHVVIWEGADVVDLGFGQASSINSAGWIAGSRPVDGLLRAAIWRPASSDEHIAILGDEVTALVTGGVLDSGNGNSLLAKLDAAGSALERGKAKTAANQMNAFVNQGEALVRSRRLTPAQGQPLIDGARVIIAGLPGESR